jgi:hypothetical protein
MSSIRAIGDLLFQKEIALVLLHMKNDLLNVAAESKSFVDNSIQEFNQLGLAEKKEGMRKLVRQVIVDRERKVARCYIRTIPPFKQHPLFDTLDKHNQLPLTPLQYRNAQKRKDELVETTQLSSSRVSVPPTGFEPVFQA